MVALHLLVEILFRAGHDFPSLPPCVLDRLVEPSVVSASVLECALDVVAIMLHLDRVWAEIDK